jgi:hypothetical protein
MRVGRDGEAQMLGYFHADSLGSITAPVEECGEMVEQLPATAG